MEILCKHIENAQNYGFQPVVAINHFATDSEEEIKFLKDECAKLGVHAVLADEFMHGGEGMRDLAKTVVEATEQQSDFRFLYSLEESIEAKNTGGSKENIWSRRCDLFTESKS